MSRPQARSSSYRKKAAAGASSHHHHGGKAHYAHGGRPAARWPARIMGGLRKVLVGLFPFPAVPPKVTFSVDGRSGQDGGGGDAAVPKRPSCSGSNLQPVNNAHYDEAIADCVEFFHRSARVDVRSRPPSSSTHF